MALVLRTLYGRYHHLFHEFQDPRVDDYPLVHSPIPLLTILGAYLFFVLKWGPEYMKDRKPYDLRNIIRAYNLYQVIINLFVATYALYNSYLQSEFSFTCQLHDPTNTKPYMRNLILATYLSYLGKYVDMLDTVFFVLRKKNNQITFLHVYHHAGITFVFYCFLKFASGSHSTFVAIFNNYVHVFMYGYYFLTSLEGNSTKYAWCKKYITQLQLIQFICVAIHYGIALVNADCKHPLFINIIMFVQDVFMMILFSDFYFRTYVMKKTNNCLMNKKINNCEK